MGSREFHLGDVLTVTTGVLLSPRGMEGVYDILGYMAGEQLWTHQLPRVAKEAEPVLLDQHPFLANIEANGVGPSNYHAWLAEQVKKFGETLSVRPMTEDEHERIDPLSEAAEKFPPDKIVVVQS